MEIQPTSNIPSTGFTATNTESVDAIHRVQFNNNASFTFSAFSLLQFLFGAAMAGAHDLDTARLINAIAIYGIESPQGEHRIELNRSEVIALKRLLEHRMRHCEQERDDRALSPASTEARTKYSHEMTQADVDNMHAQKFNPDTYIAQKFLLLDLREWLAGDIID